MADRCIMLESASVGLVANYRYTHFYVLEKTVIR